MSFTMVSGSSNKYSKVLWSPNSQPTFLVGGSDLRLYEYGAKKGSHHPPRLSMVAIHTDLPLMKCFDWSRDSATPNIVAVGQSTGKTCLVKLQPTNLLPVSGTTSVENTVLSEPDQYLRSPGYMPSLSGVAGTILTLNVRHTRACNAVAFSPANSHFLATGLEKVRNDSSLLVWDLNATLPVTRVFNQSRDNSGAAQSPDAQLFQLPTLGREGGGDFRSVRSLPLAPSSSLINALDEPPQRQYCPSEAVFSLAWLHGSSNELLGGLGLKRVRLFDLRDPGSSAIFTTKAVYGIQLDPFRPHRFLAHSEDGLVNVWDRRKAAGPLLAFQADCRSQLPVVRFSPTQSNQIAVLDKEDSRVRVYSLADARDELAGEAAPVVWKTRQALESQSGLTSFCWVPAFVCGKSNQELLCLTREGALETYPVRDASSVAWSPTGIATAELSRLSIYTSRHCEENQSPGWNMAAVMHSRAKAGYGLDPAKNRKVCAKSPDLVEVWEWAERICQMQEAGQTKADGIELAFQGLATILNGGPSSRSPASQVKAKDSSLPRKGSQSSISTNRLSTLSETPIVPDFDAEFATPTSKRKASSNPPERQRASQTQPPRMLTKYRRKLLALEMLNSFEVSGRDDVEASVANLEEAGDWERAAKCALLMVSLDRAVEVLQRSGVERHRLMAIALAGRSHANAPWSEQIRTTALSLPEPGLQAVFLYAWRENWSDVLEHTTLPLRDCLWIAIRFLEADDLRRYLEQRTSELVHSGSIAGVLLTGLQASNTCELIASYVDHSGDVQSAALLLSLAPRAVDPRVATCVEFYRGLLDQWGMWRARCSFDVARRHRASRLLVNLPAPPPQVLVRCNFCNANIGPPFPSQPHNSSPSFAKARRSAPAATGASSSSAPPPATPSTSPLKPTACPNCKKPLPRCALCLLHLGTPADASNPSFTGLAPPLGAISTVPSTSDTHSPTTPLSTGSIATSTPHHAADASPTNANSFNYWFSWCQTCRHGGHASHLAQWFQRHSICPVADCRCTCSIN